MELLLNTVCHGAWAYLASNHTKKFKWFFMVGSVFPDTALIAIGVFKAFKGQLHVFSHWLPQLFANSWMYPVNNSWHSIPIWSLLLLLAIIFRLQKIRWLIYGVYLHLLIDIFTHRHFVPEYFFLYPLLSSKGW